MTNESVCSIIIKSSGNDECGSGGTGRRARLRGVWFTPYGFKSRFPHQKSIKALALMHFLLRKTVLSRTASLCEAVRSTLASNSERSERCSTSRFPFGWRDFFKLVHILSRISGYGRRLRRIVSEANVVQGLVFLLKYCK